MSYMLTRISFDMLAMRIFNEADDLSHAHVRQIMDVMLKEMIKCIGRRESLDIEGLGLFTVRERDFRALGFPGGLGFEVVFQPAKVLKDIVIDNLSPGGRYVSDRFTMAECDEIRTKILSGKATIKGTARALNAAVKTIQKIVRNVPTKTPADEQEEREELWD